MPLLKLRFVELSYQLSMSLSKSTQTFAKTIVKQPSRRFACGESMTRTRNVTRILLITLILFGLAQRASAQEEVKDAKAAETKAGDQKPAETPIPKEQSSTTDHTIRLGGQTVPYKATASTTC